MGVHTINHDFHALEIQAGDLSAGPENSIGIICHIGSIPGKLPDNGPIYADQEELAHEPDEYLEIEQLKTMTEIYEKALENLLL